VYVGRCRHTYPDAVTYPESEPDAVT